MGEDSVCSASLILVSTTPVHDFRMYCITMSLRVICQRPYVRVEETGQAPGVLGNTLVDKDVGLRQYLSLHTTTT